MKSYPTQNSKLKTQNCDYGWLLALLLPIFAIMPLLTHAGLPNTADGPVHLMRQVELNRAWQEGNFYPRWGTDLAFGHGMPIFSYAPPSLYQLTQIFHLTGLPLDESMKAVVILGFLLYSLGMYLFVRRIFGPAPALVAAALYVYAPYRLREAYIQGNYGQFTGLAFYPWIFWAYHGLITDGRPRYLIAAAVSLAGLLLSHNISAMLFAPLLAAYLLFLLILETNQPDLRFTTLAPERSEGVDDLRKSWPTYWLKIVNRKHLHFVPVQVSKMVNSLWRTLVATLLGLGLAAIFWLPAFGERDQIKLEGITRGFFDFRQNFISLGEFLSPPRLLDLAAINPEFPLSLGLPHLIAAALAIFSLAFIVTNKPFYQPSIQPTPSPRSPSPLSALRSSLPAPQLAHTLFFTLFLLLYAFLALPYSQPIWEAVPLLELAEFPWRMLGPALFCASFLAAPAVAIINEQLSMNNKIVPWLIVVCSLFMAIALNAYYLYPAQFIPRGTPGPADAFAYEAASGAIGTTSTGEFLPRAAQKHPSPETLWPDYAAGRPPQKLDPATLPAGAVVASLNHRAESDSLQIDTPEPFVATLRTLYWPGWQIYLNGQPIEFSVTPETGLLQVQIPPGQHTLTLQLESTPLRTTGQWLTIMSALILISLALFALTRRINPAVNRQRSAVTSPSPQPVSLRFCIIAVALLIGLYLLSRPLAPLFTLQSDPNRPQPADQHVQVDFGDRLRLVGLDNLPDNLIVEPGQPAELTATLYWRALRELDTNYAVFLHLDAPNGQTYATVDERHPDNIPTRNWPPGLYLRNPLHLIIAPDTPPIRYDINVGVYDPDTGERLAIAPGGSTTYTLGSIHVAQPPPHLTGEPLAVFGPGINLLQVDRPTHQNTTLTFYWQTVQPINGDYTIFVHLLDAQGNLLGQLDGVPYDGLYPLADWLPGQIITDVRALPPMQLDELNAVAIGLYDPVSGERLPAKDAQGNLLLNNSLTIPVTP